MCFAKHGRTKEQLVEFVQANLNVSVRQISRQIRELAIAVDGDGKLSLPANLVCIWRDVYPRQHEPDVSAGGSAA